MIWMAAFLSLSKLQISMTAQSMILGTQTHPILTSDRGLMHEIERGLELYGFTLITSTSKRND